MSFFDDTYLFTDELPAQLTLEKNLGRTFKRRESESTWFLMPFQLLISLGDFFTRIGRGVRGKDPIWDQVTFQKNRVILLESSYANEEKEIALDDVLLVAGEQGLHPVEKEGEEGLSLLGWKFIDFVCKDGTHQARLPPEACRRVYTLAVQANPYVIGVDATHQIYLSEALKEDSSAKQRDALLEAARMVLQGRTSRSLFRAFVSLFASALFVGAIVAWVATGGRIRGLMYLIGAAAFLALANFFRALADAWDIKKRRIRLSP